MDDGVYHEVLQITSQFKFCPNAFRIDMYRGCNFGCRYCFANNQTFGELDTNLSIFRVGDIEALRRKFEVAFNTDKPRKSVLIELLRHKVPLHCGGMADPFQTREWELGLTKELIKLSKEYNYPICFSTKTNHLPDEYFELLDPKLHAFQVSILGWSDEFVKKWETNTSSAKERLDFVKDLRKRGFWCSVRIQPVIDIEEALELVRHIGSDCDYISVEHLHIKPKGGAKDKALTKYVNTNDYVYVEDQWIVKKDIKINNLNRIKEIANKNGVKIGAADNDLHYLSQSRCCCGIDTINENFDNYLKFNTTYLSTGESNIKELFIPESNMRQHMNIGRGKPTVYFKDIVSKYIAKYPEQLGPYRESVEKQLFGVSKKKLF